MPNTSYDLTQAEASCAANIQKALDEAAKGVPATVNLPEMDIVLDRGVELRSGVELAGQGEKTVLRKGPGRVYPLKGYHNYGMCDAPLQSAGGLAPGMTVSVRDDARRGFYSTFARITWVDGDWVGLDRGICADYAEDARPRLATVFPLLFGLGVRDARVRDLRLEGNSADQEEEMDACRGAALYLYGSRDVEFANVVGRDYKGEGLGFQMCRNVRVSGCRFEGNSGNGFHPGAGSTDCVFEDCVGRDNGKSGFFFCVRANHIDVRNCAFDGNAFGVSVGTRDCHNFLDNCRMEGNKGPGILFRKSPPSCAPHSVVVQRCKIRGNAKGEGGAQAAVEGNAHDLAFQGNCFARSGGAAAGIAIGAGARGIFLDNNDFGDCSPGVQADRKSLAERRPAFEAGCGKGDEAKFRHLAPLWDGLAVGQGPSPGCVDLQKP